MAMDMLVSASFKYSDNYKGGSKNSDKLNCTLSCVYLRVVEWAVWPSELIKRHMREGDKAIIRILEEQNQNF